MKRRKRNAGGVQVRPARGDRVECRTIVPPCFDMVVLLTEANTGVVDRSLTGRITSNLHHGDSGNDDSAYKAAIDGIESLILAHACAGVNIRDPVYLAGIQTAVEAASNHL
jgi:hypothetical protein